ncbi:MAG: hypothetical protein ABIR59_02310 [Gemmatimonadales bacterium]
MFIELTDHLRCPAPHSEAFLVLLPHAVDGRRVVSGHLGCPVCGWGVSWEDGTPDFGGGAATQGTPPFDAAAAIAMLGLDGPGGWVATAGNAGSLAGDIATLLPGVHVVAVNPPEGVRSASAVSVIRSGSWPVKQHAMRGVVVGDDAGDVERAVRSVLPGLRACGTGPRSEGGEFTLLASAGDAWVVVHNS